MPLPEMTALQFLVLTALRDSELSGSDLRKCLAAEGASKSLAAFYQLMSRLEGSGWVEGWYEHEVIDGYPVKERHYRVTGLGSRAWEDTRNFYAIKAQPGLLGA